MNVLLISNVNAVGLALQNQFAARRRTCSQISPAEIDSLTDDCLQASCVVDTEILALLQRQGLGEAELQLKVSQRKDFYARCEERGTPVLLLSDGRVFDGAEAVGAYPESAPPQPLSESGRQLRQFEAALEQSGARHVILRTGPVVAAEGEDFLRDCILGFREGRTQILNNTVKCCPTPVTDLARVISGMIDQLACDAPCAGAYHYNSSGQSSAYEFAEVVYAFVSQLVNLPVSEDKALEATDSGGHWQPSVPALACQRILLDFGIKQLPWRVFLPKLVKTLCEELHE